MTKESSKPSHSPRFHRYLQLLAGRVQALRRRDNVTMEQLAIACGVTRGTIHKIEHPSEKEDLSLGTVWAIAQHFNVPLDEMLQGIDKSLDDNGDDALANSQQWLEKEDMLAFSLVSELISLQVRADLSEQACLVANDEQQLESLAQHSAKLRQRRYALLLKQREAR